MSGLTAQSADGRPVPLGPAGGGRTRAILFFATWCESYLANSRPATSRACRQAREKVDALIGHDDVAWLGIAGGPWSHERQDLTQYQADTGTRLPLALDADGSIFRAFGVTQIPSVALIDGRGHLVKVIGPRTWTWTKACCRSSGDIEVIARSPADDSPA